MSESCENCRFWYQFGRTEDGNCRRYPPRLFPKLIKPGHDLDSASRWPVTHCEAWCGEWQPKPGCEAIGV